MNPLTFPLRPAINVETVGRRFALIPYSLLPALCSIYDLSAIYYTAINYKNVPGGDATHVLLQLPTLDRSWQQWLSVHQEAIIYIEQTPPRAQARIFVQSGFLPCFVIEEAITQLPEGSALLLRGHGGPHLLISQLNGWRPVKEALKPQLDVSKEIVPLPNMTLQGLIKLRLQPRAEPVSKYAALVATGTLERAALAGWVVRAPAPLLEILQLYRDAQRDIIFVTDNGRLPTIVCGQLLVEWGAHNGRRLCIPHNFDLIPHLPPSLVLSALGVSRDQCGVLLMEDGEIRQLIIAKDQIIQLQRSQFKPSTAT
ncbi:MAG: hypothetical protein AB1489_17070 [Acidobacteriota bacterium]